jgi:hypothetical protein
MFRGHAHLVDLEPHDLAGGYQSSVDSEVRRLDPDTSRLLDQLRSPRTLPTKPVRRHGQQHAAQEQEHRREWLHAVGFGDNGDERDRGDQPQQPEHQQHLVRATRAPAPANQHV